jgi:hypothetical protein
MPGVVGGHVVISDEPCAVPTDDSGEQAFIEFAHTYDGYADHGGLEALGELAHHIRLEWQQTGDLPDDVDVLRGCLFYQVRAHRHSGGWSPFDGDSFVRALVQQVRSLSGGTVPLRR